MLTCACFAKGGFVNTALVKWAPPCLMCFCEGVHLLHSASLHAWCSASFLTAPIRTAEPGVQHVHEHVHEARCSARHKCHQAARRCRLKFCSEPRQSFRQPQARLRTAAVLFHTSALKSTTVHLKVLLLLSWTYPAGQLLWGQWGRQKDGCGQAGVTDLQPNPVFWRKKRKANKSFKKKM